MANINLDNIIRNSRTAKEAYDNAVMQSGTLTDTQKTSLAQRILNSSKYKGNYSGGGGSSFTGGGSGGSGGSGGGGGGGSASAGEGGNFFEKGANLISNGVKTVFGLANGAVKIAGLATSEILESQMGKSEDSSLLEVARAIGDKGLMAGAAIPEALMKATLSQLKDESVLLSEVNTKTGISGQLSEGLRDSMIAASVEAKRYGFSLSEIGDFYVDLTQQSGKFALINKTTIVEASKTAAALGMSLTEMSGAISDYEKVGIGAKETTKAIGDAAVRSISLGLNARKVSDTMKDSIGKLNEFGFKNGVAGLERMVQKSIEFKVSMENVSTIAEKVLNPEGAIDLAANLQVLGGAIGDFGDPIKMMYDATNNVEGLQDSLIGAAKGLASYNQQQGKFEITGINLRRAREMAGALGISMGDLTKTAIAAQERMAASTALMSTGLKMEDKDKEFLTNLSRMQDGEMKIVVPESLQDQLGKQSEITLSKLTEDQRKVLIANKEAFEKMSPEKMAQAQLTEAQKMSRDIEVMAAWAKVQAASFVRGAGKAAVGKEVSDLKDVLAKTAGDMKVDRNAAETAGANVVGAVKNLKWSDLQSYKDTGASIKSNLGMAFNPGQSTTVTQQQQPQEIKQTVHFTSDVPAGYLSELAKKDAAFGFEFKNTKGYDVLSIANKKGK
jgi:hypothetical protein